MGPEPGISCRPFLRKRAVMQGFWILLGIRSMEVYVTL